MSETPCPDGKHSYEPLISGVFVPGVGAREYLTCRKCGVRTEITPEMEAGWRAHYERCVAEGREYHGLLGDYWPPGVDHPPYA